MCFHNLFEYYDNKQVKGMKGYRFSYKEFSDLELIELYDILKLRQEVFVVEQDCVYQDVDNKDQSAIHVMVHDHAERLVAYTRLLNKGISYDEYASIGRVVNAQSVRGQGVGKAVMKLSMDLCQQFYPGLDIKISAQSYLEDFYSSLGFVPMNSYYLEDNIPHQAMIFKVDK